MLSSLIVLLHYSVALLLLNNLRSVFVRRTIWFFIICLWGIFTYRWPMKCGSNGRLGVRTARLLSSQIFSSTIVSRRSTFGISTFFNYRVKHLIFKPALRCVMICFRHLRTASTGFIGIYWDDKVWSLRYLYATNLLSNTF